MKPQMWSKKLQMDIIKHFEKNNGGDGYTGQQIFNIDAMR